jgi:hypothetical protein
MVAKIGECPSAETEEEEMQRLLNELDGMSDEEAQRLVTEQGETNKGIPGGTGE